MPTARDVSVMPVQFAGEDVPQERRVRNRSGSLRAGSICEVELGATWDHTRRPPQRRPGAYVRCEVTRLEGALVYVRRVDANVATACRCYEGWACEDHPDQPLNHDGCDGAGRQCLNPHCPWWRGPSPAALNISLNSTKPS
jgi:hypothetical protein